MWLGGSILNCTWARKTTHSLLFLISLLGFEELCALSSLAETQNECIFFYYTIRRPSSCSVGYSLLWMLLHMGNPACIAFTFISLVRRLIRPGFVANILVS